MADIPKTRLNNQNAKNLLIWSEVTKVYVAKDFEPHPSLFVHTLLAKINWPPGNKLIENHTKCTVTTLCLQSYFTDEVTW